MPLFNFKKQFADKVRSGEKHQTIRATRKVIPKKGETAYCYTGLRTKKCEKLGEWEIKEVHAFDIWDNGEFIFDHYMLTAREKENLAINDGFKNHIEMRDWFKKTHGLPFEGILIVW